MNKNQLRLVLREPTVNQYNLLRQSVGWESIEKYRANLALKNSLLSICALYEDELIGIGRVVGDGALYFYVQDIIVSPKYQNQGVGKQIMENIMSNINKLAKQKSGAFIGLMCGKDVAPFYAKFDFKLQSEDVPFMNIWKKVDR
ncbi:GNAT family N-acetyltransferase [Vibrio genomosp. F10]|uniref:GNAT family N-acetyltransferase n=1 Tax=Vibrio genomosp. F10 TaxID=723171 RepID=UPI0003038D01|nr:GNAT family N-acetyltransferase [Vibrio genomosp. F10]OEF05712.1 GNAT family N-acetyltransferase [Vibrio genomosp. F10 str. 9ZD137]OEF07794.1 GNAT family N-acetyltransferase [Vibrio genomosp. F10 str. 9ZB36]